MWKDLPESRPIWSRVGFRCRGFDCKYNRLLHAGLSALGQVQATWYPDHSHFRTWGKSPWVFLLTLLLLWPSGQCAILFHFMCQEYNWPAWQIGKLCLHFMGMILCILDANVAKWTLKPHPPSFHLAKQNSAKPLSHKSMPSAWPFVSVWLPYLFLLLKAAGLWIFHLHLTSSGQTFLTPASQPYLVVRSWAG